MWCTSLVQKKIWIFLLLRTLLNNAMHNKFIKNQIKESFFFWFVSFCFIIVLMFLWLSRFMPKKNIIHLFYFGFESPLCLLCNPRNQGNCCLVLVLKAHADDFLFVHNKPQNFSVRFEICQDPFHLFYCLKDMYC